MLTGVDLGSSAGRVRIEAGVEQMRSGYFTCLSRWPWKEPWTGQAPSMRFGLGFTHRDRGGIP